MQYKIQESREAIEDVTHFATHMINEFKNPDAAASFLKRYDREILKLQTFPFGYRGISIEYRGYEIRMKIFDTYNVFFIVDASESTIFIIRVLKDRQNWQRILSKTESYHR